MYEIEAFSVIFRYTCAKVHTHVLTKSHATDAGRSHKAAYVTHLTIFVMIK